MVNKVLKGNFRDRKSTDIRKGSDEQREHRHLTSDEINCICEEICKTSRYPDQDELVDLMAYRYVFPLAS
ncbi:MAG: hypothetical protein EP297_15420 [Gammaproteobacteria bacterium]|nr:MAG: hypothetical protein EP297_15420 [Gammaproteobacteria bacterium]